MPRKPARDDSSIPYQQLPLDFNAIIKSAEVLSREDVANKSRLQDGQLDYDPVAQTTEYMRRAVKVEEAWETTVNDTQISAIRYCKSRPLR